MRADVVTRARVVVRSRRTRARVARSTRASGVSAVNDAGRTRAREKVVVVGASGGVGQLCVAMTSAKGYDVVAVTRRLGVEVDGENVEWMRGIDCRDARAIERAFDESVTHCVCCLGTTAFPSARWRDEEGKFTNGPEATDYVSVRNVVDAAKKRAPNLKRFVLVSSVGVLRTGVMPFIILNAFGVLKWKREGEKYLEKSGLPYTVLRPGRLTDGPYTSYDLNTLLKATSGTKRAVQIGTGDELLPEATSRIVVAEAACAALELPSAAGRAFELGSTEGDGPGDDVEKWRQLFDSV